MGIVSLFLFSILYGHAGIILDDVSSLNKQSFSWRHVCSKMVSHESPLIDKISAQELDCMGKKVSASQFCDRAISDDPYYIRAYVKDSPQEVTCVSARKVMIKYQCVKMQEHSWCRSKASESCAKMQQTLARRLPLIHASVTKNDRGIKELNCYFEAQADKSSSL
jgi:hypothetical protein